MIRKPSFDERERQLLKMLQGDLPLAAKPFRWVAEKLAVDESTVLSLIGRLIATGIIRRFGALVHHGKAGYVNNALVLWDVAPADMEQAAAALTSHPGITHCYERRPPFEGTFSLFTMIHGRYDDDQSLEKQVERLSEEAGIGNYKILESLEEYKKTSMEYF